MKHIKGILATTGFMGIMAATIIGFGIRDVPSPQVMAGQVEAVTENVEEAPEQVVRFLRTARFDFDDD